MATPQSINKKIGTAFSISSDDSTDEEAVREGKRVSFTPKVEEAQMIADVKKIEETSLMQSFLNKRAKEIITGMVYLVAGIVVFFTLRAFYNVLSWKVNFSDKKEAMNWLNDLIRVLVSLFVGALVSRTIK